MKTNNQLLNRLSEDMQLRGMSKHTQRSYKKNIINFLDYCDKTDSRIIGESAREFLIHLLQEGNLCAGTINLHNAAIRFFFAVTLNQTMNYLQMPRFKKAKSLPEFFSRQEVQELIMNCANLKHKSFLLLAYGGGLRISEVAALKIKDIDSKEMRIFVRAGKGKKDRYTILSNECLCVLREYWSVYRPKHPDGWLFPGMKNVDHVTAHCIENAFKKQVKINNISKSVSMHTLRHSFATHLLEDGVNIFQIKELLGHASISSTTVYLHLANTTANVISPADRFIPYD